MNSPDPLVTDDDLGDLEYGRCAVCAAGIKRRGRHGPWLHVEDGRSFSRAIRPHHAEPLNGDTGHEQAGATDDGPKHLGNPVPRTKRGWRGMPPS